jgi:hypothetical protein
MNLALTHYSQLRIVAVIEADSLHRHGQLLPSKNLSNKASCFARGLANSNANSL